MASYADEEQLLKTIAYAYAVGEHTMAVLSNHRTDKSYIYYGKTSEVLGIEQVIRMRDKRGQYHHVRHRIRYFRSQGKPGIGYALCLYTITDQAQSQAMIFNLLTGERKPLEIDDSKLLTTLERAVLRFISVGMSSKYFAHQLCISKHTIDHHRQNIIKLQVNSTTEACFKAQQLGLI